MNFERKVDCNNKYNGGLINRRMFFSLVVIAITINSSLSSIVKNDNSSSNVREDLYLRNNFFPTEEQIGFPGETSYGVEPSLIKSPIQPLLSDHYPILQSSSASSTLKTNNTNSDFRPIESWGNLSPLRSLEFDRFGIKSSPTLPNNCTLDQVHVLHRHGARYPTSGNSLIKFGKLIHAAQQNGTLSAKGPLNFLNHWNYQLGTEVLTPFGRSQMFQLGVSYRQKYGFLLSKVPKGSKLVFRTTSQDRMYHSALNFGAGFFGIPAQDHYHQSILIEAEGFNNTLASYNSCPRSEIKRYSDAGQNASKIWRPIYLKNALKRFNELVSGIKFTIEDIYSMQQICSYETVSLGTSQFCDLFNEQEWKGFSHALTLEFWYSGSFGNPISPAIGLGWTEELHARLTKVQPVNGSSSINVTLDLNPKTFPLDQPIYVDATHDTVISSVFTTLNFTFLTASGPPPFDHMPEFPSYRVEDTTPFGAHLSAQSMTCNNEKFIRFILNDAVVPLTGLDNCNRMKGYNDKHKKKAHHHKDHKNQKHHEERFEYEKDGLCKLKDFTDGLKERIKQIDYQKLCF